MRFKFVMCTASFVYVIFFLTCSVVFTIKERNLFFLLFTTPFALRLSENVEYIKKKFPKQTRPLKKLLSYKDKPIRLRIIGLYVVCVILTHTMYKIAIESVPKLRNAIVNIYFSSFFITWVFLIPFWIISFQKNFEKIKNTIEFKQPFCKKVVICIGYSFLQLMYFVGLCLFVSGHYAVLAFEVKL